MIAFIEVTHLTIFPETERQRDRETETERKRNKEKERGKGGSNTQTVEIRLNNNDRIHRIDSFDGFQGRERKRSLEHSNT
jgi:hypothetical protein